MAASISSSIVASLKAFNALIEHLNSTDPNDLPETLSIGQWEDELGRLRMWAANIGAHRTGQSSLDFRLRDASHIRNQILKLLKSVDESIGSAQELLFERPDSDEETFSDDDSDYEDEAPGSILEELLASLAATIKSLFQLSMLVRKPAQHDLYAGSSRADVTAFEPFYHGHVRDKFPNADESLISRLGSASARRKMYLKYRERHAAKLRQGINNIVTKTHGETNEGATTVMSDTVATDLHNWNIDFEDSASNSGESQTSYAATLMKGDNLTIPPPPKESLEGNPFECPLCYHIVRIESTQSWNKHVFLDLQPYICLEMGCKTPQKLYAARHDWLWHTKEDHPDKRDSKSIDQEGSKCPLCGESFKNNMQLAKHSARHLQDLALFVLPQSLYEINEEEDSSTQGSPLKHEAASSSGESLVVDSLGSRDSSQGSKNAPHSSMKAKLQDHVTVYENLYPTVESQVPFVLSARDYFIQKQYLNNKDPSLEGLNREELVDLALRAWVSMPLRDLEDWESAYHAALGRWREYMNREVRETGETPVGIIRSRRQEKEREMHMRGYEEEMSEDDGADGEERNATSGGGSTAIDG